MDRTGTQHLPRRRENGIVAQEISDEVLVYDLDTHKAHCLNPTAALVWRKCDGKTSVRNIALLVGQELNASVNDEVVWLAIDQLERRHLIEKRPAQLPPPGLSRREVMRRLGLATAVALPLVTSLMAPTPAQAATCTPNGQACSTSAQCCSGICSSNVCAASLF
ncbi:MAG: PqqD family peptide modification chaperone [Pyrinomonadaceae bacterium]|nr:PqqD family peptide modification chaperone [Pyrinomonadaceae bacterium]